MLTSDIAEAPNHGIGLSPTLSLQVPLGTTVLGVKELFQHNPQSNFSCG